MAAGGPSAVNVLRMQLVLWQLVHFECVLHHDFWLHAVLLIFLQLS